MNCFSQKKTFSCFTRAQKLSRLIIRKVHLRCRKKLFSPKNSEFYTRDRGSLYKYKQYYYFDTAHCLQGLTNFRKIVRFPSSGLPFCCKLVFVVRPYKYRIPAVRLWITFILSLCVLQYCSAMWNYSCGSVRMSWQGPVTECVITSNRVATRITPTAHA